MPSHSLRRPGSIWFARIGVVVLTLPLVSCVRVGDPVRVVPAAPSEAVIEISRDFEDEGTIVVDHRRDCGRSDKPGKQDVVRLVGERQLPAFVDDATVFMNGWHFTYFDDDHNVQSVMGVIANIRRENDRLTWEALGAIEEDGFDAPYEFCYTYTIVAWNRRSLDLVSSNQEQPSVFSDAGDDHPMTNFTVEGRLTRDGPELPSFTTALIIARTASASADAVTA